MRAGALMAGPLKPGRYLGPMGPLNNYPTLYYFLVTKLNKKNKTVAKEKEKNVGKEKFFFYT
jgi:hypothetical protein